jgi:phosphonate degradation associated HDIG domain protein
VGDVIDDLEALFSAPRAQALYLGEAVSVAGHMLQCAALARVDGAPDALVAAALLHDIGHLVDPDVAETDADTQDRRHEEIAAATLAAHFPPEVVEAVRLHVAAKRYLCGVKPDYHDALSPASRHTLVLQGGPMCADEVAAFRETPFHQGAVRVRLWDDAGKVADAPIPTFSGFRPVLERLVLSRSR